MTEGYNFTNMGCWRDKGKKEACKNLEQLTVLKERVIYKTENSESEKMSQKNAPHWQILSTLPSLPSLEEANVLDQQTRVSTGIFGCMEKKKIAWMEKGESNQGQWMFTISKITKNAPI